MAVRIDHLQSYAQRKLDDLVVLMRGFLNRFYVVQIDMKGITGPIRFDDTGSRTNFRLPLFELTREGLKHVSNFENWVWRMQVLPFLFSGWRLDTGRAHHLHEQLHTSHDGNLSGHIEEQNIDGGHFDGKFIERLWAECDV